MIVEESLAKIIMFILIVSCGGISLFGAFMMLVSDLSGIKLKNIKYFRATFFTGVFGLMLSTYIFFILLMVGIIN